MPETLNYAGPRTASTEQFSRALPIALIGCPLGSIIGAIIGCQSALDSTWLSMPNLSDSLGWGFVVGVAGGIFIAILCHFARPIAVPISIVCSSLVVIGSALSWHVLVAAMSC
jgi:hypothetical protein